VMATIGVGFEWHGRTPKLRATRPASSYPSRSRYDLCNKVPHGLISINAARAVKAEVSFLQREMTMIDISLNEELWQNSMLPEGILER
jgi:hypothetical protein